MLQEVMEVAIQSFFYSSFSVETVGVTVNISAPT